MSGTEKIKQIFEKERKSLNILSNPTIETAILITYSRIEKDILKTFKEEKQKLRELADLLKTRPKYEDTWKSFVATEKWFELYEKKFAKVLIE